MANREQKNAQRIYKKPSNEGLNRKKKVKPLRINRKRAWLDAEESS